MGNGAWGRRDTETMRRGIKRDWETGRKKIGDDKKF
jgi:hypothetical protein